MAITQERHTLMLDSEEYAAITSLAKTAGVVRPYVVQALLELADESQVIAKARQIKAGKRLEAVEGRKKRDALEKLAKTLKIEDIEALVKQVKNNKDSAAD